MYWIWALTGVLLAAWLQALFGSARLPLPLVQLSAFYYAVPFGRSRTAVVALPVAGLLDALLLDRALTCVLTTGAAILLAEFWRRHGNARLWVAQALPGAVLGLGTALATLVFRYGSYGLPAPGQWGRLLLYILWMGVAGGLLMPGLSLFLDACAERLQLQCFRDARRHADGFDHDAY